MKTERRTFLAFGSLAAIGLAACRAPSHHGASAAASAPSSAAADFPLRSTDSTGRVVELAQPPKRIASLLPAFTETLFALGVGAQVVGVDDFSDYPPEAQQLPRLGGSYDAHVEQILSLKPELVLCAKDLNGTAALAQNHVSFWSGDARSLDDVFREIESVGQLVGRRDAAKQLTARMHAELAALEASVRGAPRVSVYYELDPTPYSVGPGSFIGLLLDKAGAQNIVPKELGDFPKLSPELILAQNPAVILGAHLPDLTQRPGWSQLSAVQHGRVYTLTPDEDHLISRPGPRLPEALRILIHHLHPELG
jgi:iron complex transport system substrate-binding protein